MTTQDIFTALSYPDGTRKIGNCPDKFDAFKHIAANYKPNTKLMVTENEITVIDKDTFKSIRKDASRTCVLVDTQDGKWNDIYIA